METRTCIKCGAIRPITDYHKNSSSPGGRLSTCKDCHNEHRRQMKGNSPARIAEENNLLTQYHSRELIAELRRRGYSGKLSFTQEVVI